MKKYLLEKVAYQWQVLGWRGTIAVSVIFAAICGYLALMILVAINIDELSSNSADLNSAILFYCISAVSILFLLWVENCIWNEFEKYA